MTEDLEDLLEQLRHLYNKFRGCHEDLMDLYGDFHDRFRYTDYEKDFSSEISEHMCEYEDDIIKSIDKATDDLIDGISGCESLLEMLDGKSSRKRTDGTERADGQD